MTIPHVLDSPAAAEVDRLRVTFATGRTRDLDWRRRQLDALERMLVECEAVIAEALAHDLGRPPQDAFMGDIMPPLAEVKFAKKHLRTWVKPQRVSLPLAQRP